MRPSSAQELSTQELLNKREDLLLVLSNRLRTSTYEDDKEEALIEIAMHTICGALSVGTICMKDLFCSIPEMSSHSFHFLILDSLFKSTHAAEFAEMLGNDSSCILAFFEMRTATKASILKLIKCKAFYRILLSDSRSKELIDDLAKSNYYAEINLLVSNSSEEFKASLVCDKFLESLLATFQSTSQPDIQSSICSLICTFLDNSSSSLYFLKSQLYSHPSLTPSLQHSDQSLNLIFNLLGCLLNPKYEFISESQNKLFNSKIVKLALKNKKYFLINKLIFRNANTFSRLVKHFLDFSLLSADAENHSEALWLYELCLDSGLSKQLTISGYKTAILFLERGMDAEIDSFISDIEKYLVLFDKNVFNSQLPYLLLYVLLKYNNIDELAVYFNPDKMCALCSSDSVSFGLWLLLARIHGLPTNLSEHSVLEILGTLRASLCNKKVQLSIKSIEMLVTSITEMISNMEIKERIELVDVETENTELEETEVEEKQVGVFEGVMRAFKKDKSHETFDL